MKQFYGQIGKRLLDLVIASLSLVLLAPLMVWIAILVRLTLGAPVLFRQQRPGWHEQLVTVTKFRTMNDWRDTDGELLPDSARLSRLGRLLRRTSLDELPQLWSVLTGKMSLIGPRPLFVQYLPFYTERERRRHTVRPGITGLAQINGRKQLPWDERLELDVQYVEHLSLTLDLYIMFVTAWKVIAGSDNVEAPRRAFPPLTDRKHWMQPPS